MLETNAFRAGDERADNAFELQLHTHTHKQLATSDFKTRIITDSYSPQKQLGVITLSHSPPLHPKALYEIAVSSGLNDL